MNIRIRTVVAVYHENVVSFEMLEASLKGEVRIYLGNRSLDFKLSDLKKIVALAELES